MHAFASMPFSSMARFLSDTGYVTLYASRAYGRANEADESGIRPVGLALRMGHKELFAALKDYGVDLTARSPKDRSTLLHQTCWAGHVEMTALLLRSGAFNSDQINAQDAQGRTALHVAAFRAPEAVCSLLVDAGARPQPSSSCIVRTGHAR